MSITAAEPFLILEVDIGTPAETGAPELAYLNFRLAVARGERRKGGVRLEVFEVV